MTNKTISVARWWSHRVRLPLAAAITATIMLAASLPMTNDVANASTPSVDPVASVPASLASAAWSDLKGHDGHTVTVARASISVAPGGSAIWGAVITAGTDTLGDDHSLELVFSDVPANVTLTPAKTPANMTSDQVDEVTGCLPVGTSVRCTLANPVASGKTVATAVSISAPRTATTGTIMSAPVSLSNRGATVTSTPLNVQVVPGIKNSLYYSGVSSDIQKVGEKQRRVAMLYNLGGARPKAGKARVSVKGVVAPKLIKNAHLAGRAWKCAAIKSCTWSGRLPTGASTTALNVDYQVNKVRGLDPTGNRSKRVLWDIKLGGDKTFATAPHTESVGVLTPKLSLRNLKQKSKRHGSLSAQIIAVGQQRLGGLNRYRVVLHNGGGKPVKDPAVRIQPPAHSKIIKITSKSRWQCQAAGACSYRRALPKHGSTRKLEFLARSDIQLAKKRAAGKFRATAQWHEGKKLKQSRGAVDKVWAPVPTVSVSSTSRVIYTASGNDGHLAGNGMLTAKVNGLQGYNFGRKWRAVCDSGKKCPKVKWTGKAAGTMDGKVTEGTLTKAFTVPAVKRKTVFTFVLTINVQGAIVSGSTKVVVRPGDLTVDPNLATSQGKPGKLAPMANRSKITRIKTKELAKLRVGSRGPSTVKAGRKATLKLNISKGAAWDRKTKVRKVTWRFHNGAASVGQTAKTTRKGQTLQAVIPANLQGQQVIVSAIAKFNNGKTATTTELIKVGASKRPTPGGIGASAPTPAQQSAFCTVFQAVSSGGGSVPITNGVLTVGNTTITGASCTATNAQIAFSNGGLVINGVQLVSLNGTITPTGLSITSGTITLPTNAPNSLTQSNFASGQSTLSAGFGSAGLGPLTGTISGLPLFYLPLPSGWTINSSIDFANSGGAYQVTLQATATQPSGTGTIGASGSISSSGAVTINVAAANLWQLTGSNGSTSEFSGQGTVTAGPGQQPTASIDLEMVTNGTTFVIYGGFGITPAPLNWNANGFTFSSQASVPIGTNVSSYTVSGTFTNFSNWSLSVTQVSAISMRDLIINNLTGTIAMTNGKLSIAISGNNTNFLGLAPFGSFNVTVTNAVANLGIYCGTKKEKKDKSCQNQTIQLQLDLTGTLTYTFFGSPATIPLSTTVLVNTATGNWQLTAKVDKSGGFGPDILHIHDVKFFYTEQPQFEKALKGSVCMQDPTLMNASSVFGATATFTIGSWSGPLLIVYNKAYPEQGNNGLCAEFRSSNDTDVAAANSMVPGGSEVGTYSDQVVLIYSTYQTSITLNGYYPAAPNTNSAWITIPATTASLIGTFSLGGSYAGQVGGPGAITVQLSLGQTVRSITGYYDFPDGGVCLAGSCTPSATSAYLNSLSLGIQQGGYWVKPVSATNKAAISSSDSPCAPSAVEASAKSLKSGRDPAVHISHNENAPTWCWGGPISLVFSANATIVTSGSTDTSNPNNSFSSNNIPVSGFISVTLTAPLSVSVGFQIGDGQNINNAFGVSGLVLQELEVVGTFGPTLGVNLGFSASIVLPTDKETTMGGAVYNFGIEPGTPMSIAIEVGYAQPCFMLSIGYAQGNTLALDLYVLEANYVEFIFAPNGCDVSTDGVAGMGGPLAQGYGIGFDGTIFGDNAQVFGEWGSNNAPGWLGTQYAEGELDINVGGFDLAGVQLDNTVFDLDFGFSTDNPSAGFGIFGYFDLTVAAGVNLWGTQLLSVTGDIDINLGIATNTVSINLAGNLGGNMLGIFEPGVNFTLNVDFAIGGADIGSFSQLGVGAQGTINYGIILGSVGLDFDYQNGIVCQVSGTASVGINLYAVQAIATATISYTRPTTGGDGNVLIQISGTINYWMGTWHTLSGNLVNYNVPVDFATPGYAPNTPHYVQVPANPISYWNPSEWAYTSQMFMGIPWDSSALAAAAGITNPVDLSGTQVSNPTLGTPSLTFQSSAISLNTTTSGTTTSVTVTVSLPETPTYASVIGNAKAAGTVPPARIQAAMAANTACSGQGTTQTVTLTVPDWNNGAPQQDAAAAFVTSEINWRMFLASVIEKNSISGAQASTPIGALESYTCGYNNWANFPSLQDWFNNPANTLGTQFNMGYPQVWPNNTSQYCPYSPENPPNTAYATTCLANVASMNGAWGLGWGAGGVQPPPP